MSINFKEIMNKVKETTMKGAEVYLNATDKAERFVMTKCGSEKMMNDVADELTTIAISKVRGATKKVTDKTTPVVKTISDRVHQCVSRVRVCVPAIPKKEQPKQRSVPICRPIPHIPAGVAPMSGVPVSKGGNILGTRQFNAIEKYT